MKEILSMTALELAAAMRRRDIRPTEAVDAVFQCIAEKEPMIHAYISLFEDDARRRAVDAEKRILAREDLPPLFGVPISVKDNLCTRNRRTTAGSRMLQSFVPPYSATAVERLENAGLIVIGKTNLDEFGMGSTTENSAFGATMNPRNETLVPGGSSGGAAASVVARECFVALGTDTGGSVRTPAAWCGCYGFKPSYGRISRYGLIAYASSMDTVGILARSPLDAAVMCNTISGADGKDMTAVGGNYLDTESAENYDIRGKRIGIPTVFMEDKLLDADIRSAVEEVVLHCERSGAVIKELSIPSLAYSVATYYTLACAEAASNLARYDGIRYGYCIDEDDDVPLSVQNRTRGFGKEVKNRIMLGNYVLSTGHYDDYYRKALARRAKIREEMDAAFDKVDIILSPVTRKGAPQIGKSLHHPVSMMQEDAFTVAANLYGGPAASLPIAEGIGLGIMGKSGDDASVIGISNYLANAAEVYQ
ncbi:MAG TPA: Asp-tRNA(Asn)/Glu-tRNA(Gln) amidotransferase subunit GatA [Bacillota bacterium]|nr:Asp-tRNA(Asn)/Glu-tRNA(Gln) amidotransferase subunit GatA [Bacillota bacterium]HPE38084.1 Asp-tRNA(Asn)/Glu-tRNA(Gln) amidotransferase subunit GatA [Bacillota bacterium]